jgi:hypothetical protein
MECDHCGECFALIIPVFLTGESCLRLKSEVDEFYLQHAPHNLTHNSTLARQWFAARQRLRVLAADTK